jgi:hypothetical protein
MAIQWHEMNKDDADNITTALGRHIANLRSLGIVKVRVAELPFYDGARFYEFSATTTLGAKAEYVLCGEGRRDDTAIVIDGSTEAIRRANALGSLKLSRDNVLEYVKFVFACIAGRDGPCNVVETFEPPDAMDEEIKTGYEMLKRIIPPVISVAVSDNEFLVETGLLFKGSIFATEMEVTAEGGVQIRSEMRIFPVPHQFNGAKPSLPHFESDNAIGNHIAGPGERPQKTRIALPADFRAEQAKFLEWREIEDPELENRVKPIIKVADPEFTGTIARALKTDLVFYDNVDLIALSPQAGGPDRFYPFSWVYAVARPPLDGTNVGICRLNEEFALKMEPEMIRLYVRFFFHFVFGRHGFFHIVDRAEDILWQPDASAADKARIASMLRPLTYLGLDRSGFHCVSASIVFKNALARTNIRVADATAQVAHGGKGMRRPQVGEVSMDGEHFMAEDLPVIPQ